MDTAASERLTLRPIIPDDREFLFRLYASTREEELAAVPWSDEQKEVFLRQQFNAQHTWWTEHYAGASFDVVLLDGEPVGRLYVDRWEREIRVVDIALLPRCRGSGIGTALLSRIFTEADRNGKAVSVHVEVFNPARRLYERLGFVEKADKGVYLLLERPPAGAAAVSGPS
ncbi:MAG TPA: GNAT family N-acetyltransferase [Longimicrobiaceae bacterium]|nr:GNAT family N-acetyltransferase [Longimicrobiaceae bacterium]